MRINDSETQAIADLYREMIGEQVTGKSALTGQELVTALVTACMSKWYDLTSKFQARPEIYDVAPTQTNDSYNVMKLNPGSDVRDDAFESIVKSTNDIAKELNRLFGKDVFEPRITRQHGKLEALVAFSQNEGGVFQAKGEATEGHTTIHITMPKEVELERAFSAMTDTPHHGDQNGEEGVGDMDDTIDADPIAGDPSPDYDPEFDVPGDVDQGEVEAEFGDLDAEPEGDPMDDLTADEADAAFDEEPRRRVGESTINEAKNKFDLHDNVWIIPLEFHGMVQNHPDRGMVGSWTYDVTYFDTNEQRYKSDVFKEEELKFSHHHRRDMANNESALYDQIADVLSESEMLTEGTWECVGSDGESLGTVSGSSKSASKACKEKYGDECVRIRGAKSKLIGEDSDEDVSDDGPLQQELARRHQDVVDTILKKYKAKKKHGSYIIKGRPEEAQMIENSYITELSRKFGFSVESANENFVVNGKAYLGFHFHLSYYKDYGGFSIRMTPYIAAVENIRDVHVDAARKVSMDTGSVKEAADDMKPHKYVVKDENGKPKYEKTFPNKKAAEDFRDRQTDREMTGGVVMPVEDVKEACKDANEEFELTPGFEPAPGFDAPKPKKVAKKSKKKGDKKARTFREFVQDKEDGTPGFEPKTDTLYLDMRRVENLYKKFLSPVRSKASGSTELDKVTKNERGRLVEYSAFVIYLDWERFKHGEFSSYANQLLDHYRKHVGGEEEIDETPDPMDDDTYKLNGCKYDGMTFDVIIKNGDGDHEVAVWKIRADDDAEPHDAMESTVSEEAPAVSVGGATAAGSSPAPDVVKNIGKKKKKTKVQRRNESTDPEMGAVVEALNLTKRK